MNRCLLGGLGIILFAVLDGSHARAQFVCTPFGTTSFYASSTRFGFGFGAGFGFRTGFAFRSGFVSGGFSRFSVVGPASFWFGPPPYLGWSGAGNPWFFPPAVLTPPVFATPPPIIVVQAAPLPFASQPGFRGGVTGTSGTGLAEATAVREPAPLPDRPAIPVKREAFVVIQPGGDPVQQAAAWSPVRRHEPLARFGRNSGLRGWPDRSPLVADPAAQAALQIHHARTAFAARQYGRAGERLATAIQLRPDEPVPYFCWPRCKPLRHVMPRRWRHCGRG